MKTASLRLLLMAAAWSLALGDSARADFAFGKAVNLGPTVNSSVSEAVPVVSADGLELYFVGGPMSDAGDIMMSKRASVEDPWGTPIPLRQFNTAHQECWDCVGSISSDGLTLYLELPNGQWPDLYTATRPTKDAPWGRPVGMGPVLNRLDTGEAGPVVSADGLELFFYSIRPGASGECDIYVSTRATVADPWGPPANLGPTINSTQQDFSRAISPDGLILFLIWATRDGGRDGYETWMIRRAYKGAPWSEPVNLGPSFNTAQWDGVGSISPDGRWVYFDSALPGGYGGTDLWMAPIIPLADFNDDGVVDANDEALLSEHLGRDDLRYDIGPFPWGDGKVDANDLEALQPYLGQEAYDPALIARWKLDEAEGTVAADSVAGKNGTLMGGPLWQPGGGKIGGALEFDGLDDYVEAPFVLDPSGGPFSVFAWVQGGVAGQVILSQDKGANWLLAQVGTGTLMTDLKVNVIGKAVISPTVITDGDWHRVGLACDDRSRTLYVDGIEVAKGDQNRSPGKGGLYLGAGKTLAPGSFWSGLIDDVRIYNRAVKP